MAMASPPAPLLSSPSGLRTSENREIFHLVQGGTRPRRARPDIVFQDARASGWHSAAHRAASENSSPPPSSIGNSETGQWSEDDHSPQGSHQPRPRPGARLPPDSTPPTGPAFVLVKRRDGVSWEGTSPFQVRRQCIKACGGEAQGAKILRSGAILIKTRSAEQTENILAHTSFLGEPCEIMIADRMNTVEGLIYSRDLIGMSDEELLHELAGQGATEVVRLQSRTGKPNPLVKIRFRGLTLPSRIICGYLAVEVKRWVPSPRQCAKCWRIGHTTRACRSRHPTCGGCAGQHTHEGCNATTLCRNCGQAHPAWDRQCPKWQQAKERGQGRPDPAAPQQPPTMRPAYLSPEEWPPLAPSPHRPAAKIREHHPSLTKTTPNKDCSSTAAPAGPAHSSTSLPEGTLTKPTTPTHTIPEKAGSAPGSSGTSTSDSSDSGSSACRTDAGDEEPNRRAESRLPSLKKPSGSPTKTSSHPSETPKARSTRSKVKINL